MDKKLSLLAFTFFITPILLTACDLEGQNTTDDGQNAAVEQTTAEPEVIGKGSLNQPEDPSLFFIKLANNLPEYFQGKDVTYTGIKKLDNSLFQTQIDKAFETYKKTYEDPTNADKDYFNGLFNFYQVANINNGTHAEKKLVVLKLRCDGMCMYSDVYRFAFDSQANTLTYLQKMSTPEYNNDFVADIYNDADVSTSLSGVLLPDKIDMGNNGKKANKVRNDVSHLETHYLKQAAFTDSRLGTVYSAFKDGTGCMYIASPDGSVTQYEFDPLFFNDEDNFIEWNDGTKTNIGNNYVYTQYGCGIQGNCYYVQDVNEENLIAVGKTNNGMTMYEIKKPVSDVAKATTDEQKAFLDRYNTYRQVTAFDESKKILTFDEFVALNPDLYWKDPIGRFSSILNKEIQPPAECGKPVIYLYPEEETDVQVKVNIDEFTKTVPDYGTDGWFVRATPDSQIYNYADGQTYPYLFWEGHKKGGFSPDRGFSVKRDDLEQFLNESLDKLGLTAREKSDFIEFWLVRMLENPEPYFYISFLGTADFNKVAPLEITPAPDTLIRIFMYYNPVSKPFMVAEQNLTSIPRNGFTVVEWGGTSSRIWKTEE